jgi:enoyl-CoA hydratase/carnithine racemase
MTAKPIRAMTMRPHIGVLLRLSASGGKRHAKRMVYTQQTMSLDNALEDPALSTIAVNYTEDVKEGIAAFHAKRKPGFKGRWRFRCSASGRARECYSSATKPSCTNVAGAGNERDSLLCPHRS